MNISKDRESNNDKVINLFRQHRIGKEIDKSTIIDI